MRKRAHIYVRQNGGANEPGRGYRRLGRGRGVGACIHILMARICSIHWRVCSFNPLACVFIQSIGACVRIGVGVGVGDPKKTLAHDYQVTVTHITAEMVNRAEPIVLH